jgi:hypothetical protein
MGEPFTVLGSLEKGSHVGVISLDSLFNSTFKSWDVYCKIVDPSALSKYGYVLREKVSSKLDLQKELKLLQNRVEAVDKAYKLHNANLIKKYGSVNGKMIIEGKIWIGMTDKMCRESWGSPDEINSSTYSFGVKEQWVYGSSYVYFENGICSSFQQTTR